MSGLLVFSSLSSLSRATVASGPLLAVMLPFDACISGRASSKKRETTRAGKEKNFILKWLKAEKRRAGGWEVYVWRGWEVFFSAA